MVACWSRTSSEIWVRLHSPKKSSQKLAFKEARCITDPIVFYGVIIAYGR